MTVRYGVYIFSVFSPFSFSRFLFFLLPRKKKKGEEWSGGRKKRVCLEQAGRTQRYSLNYKKIYCQKMAFNIILFSIGLKKSVFFAFRCTTVASRAPVRHPMLRTYGKGRAGRNAVAVLMPPLSLPPSLPPRPINHS